MDVFLYIIIQTFPYSHWRLEYPVLRFDHIVQCIVHQAIFNKHVKLRGTRGQAVTWGEPNCKPTSKSATVECSPFSKFNNSFCHLNMDKHLHQCGLMVKSIPIELPHLTKLCR